MKKSLSLNAAMSAFKTLMNIIFPLITFPYASNVLQVENLGKVNFASSVCGTGKNCRLLHRRCSPSI